MSSAAANWHDYAVQKFASARQAVAEGNVDQAAKDYLIALGLVKTPGALLEHAEFLCSTGNFEGAFYRATEALTFIKENGGPQQLRTKIEQCIARAEGARSGQIEMPPYNRSLSAIIYVRARSAAELLTKIINSGTLSTNGTTLAGQGAVFNILIEEKKRSDEQESLQLYEHLKPYGYLDQSAIPAIKHYTHTVRIYGPTSSIAQHFANQQQFAGIFLRTTSALMDALGGSLIWSFHSGLMLSAQDWRRYSQSGYTFNALVFMGFGPDAAWSFGMQAIGFADVKIVAPVTASNYKEVIQEFARFQALNWKTMENPSPFYSAVLNRTFEARWQKCEFNEVNPYWYNPNGQWTLT